MKKFYIEILHPTENKVLWHYYVEAKSAELAKEAATNQFIAEQSDGLLLETGGVLIVTAEEEK